MPLLDKITVYHHYHRVSIVIIYGFIPLNSHQYMYFYIQPNVRDRQ